MAYGIKKRPRFRQVLFNFDPTQLAVMPDSYIDTLMQDSGIIRNRLKLESTRQNARAWLALADPVDFIWSVVDHTPRINHYPTYTDVPAVTPQAEALSRKLKKAGFNFVGPTICYAYMQATGMVMDHTMNCERYAALAA